MSIQEYWLKIKLYLEVGVGEWGLAILVVLIALSCFGLGRLSALTEASSGISVTMAASAAQALPGQAMDPGGQYVASRTGEVYYFPWCGAAQNLPQASKVWFDDEASAKRAGYRPAKNCKGLAE